MSNDFITNLNSVLNDTNDETINTLYNDMSKHQKNIFNKLKTNNEELSNYSLNDLVFDFDQEFIEKILNIELDLYLKENSENNKRNGYTHDIDLTIGNRKILFNRPRLRKENNFDSILIPKRTRIIKDLSDNIILLYSKNNSINDIKSILKGMFNIDLSTAFISNLIQDISDDVLKWRNKDLNRCYFAINIDCTYISIRDKKYLNSHKIPIYIAVGTKLNGHKEILGIYLGNEDESGNIIDYLYNKDIAESKAFWSNVFEDLKDRGVEKVLYVISDGLTGIEDAIHTAFENTKYQRCIVHLVRNLKFYTNKNNCKEILKDFKSIYTSPNIEIATENYEYFLEKYKDNKIIIKHVKEYINYIFPLFNIPANIRKYIYTNNIVESTNSKIKRGFYGRGALPNINSAINIIYLNLVDLENKWAKTKVSNWDNIYNELIQVYYEEIKDYLE